MPSTPHLSLVIPHYNEVERLHLMEEGLVELAKFAAHYDIEVLLVDDGSNDGTWPGLQAIADSFESKHGTIQSDFEIRCLQQYPNAGKGVALQKGVKEANGKWILTLDADMATKPIEVFNWHHDGKIDLQDHGSHIVAIGSREHPDSVVHDDSGRRFMGRMFNRITRILSGLRIKDTQCGFKLYPAGLAKEVFAELVHTGWAHDVEILKRIQKRGIPIHSLPIQWKAIEGSKVNPLTDSWKMFFALIEIRRALKKEG